MCGRFSDSRLRPNVISVYLLIARGNERKEPEMSKTQQRTAEELAALIEFCEGAKKTADANLRLCIGFKSMEARNEYFQMWRYFSKKEKELMEQLEAISN